MYEGIYEEYLRHVNMQISDEIKSFVNNDVFGDSEYLFITKIDGKNIGYCSKCKQEYEVEDLRHNEGGKCPLCNSSLKVKLSRYGRKNCKNDACFYYFEKSVTDPNVVVGKGYYVTKDYTEDFRKPQEKFALEAVYIFECNKSTMLKTAYGYRWEKRSTVFDFNQGWLAPKMCYCSFNSIKKAISGTWFQYMPYREFQGHYSMVKLFNEYSKHPAIEQLIKAGFIGIVEAKLKGYQMHKSINWKGKDIFKMLKINRKDLKDIKSANIPVDPYFLKLFQLSKEDKSNLTPKEIVEVKDMIWYSFDKFIRLLRHMTMKKVYKYIKQQQERKVNDRYHSVVSTWSDYIEDCKKLSMDITKESVLYPKDLHAAHQNTIKQIRIKEDKKLNIAIAKRLKTLYKYSLEINELLIRPAKSSIELIEEGKALSHCVGGYAERYAKGETNIFVIRKTSEPDKPFYTLEFKNDSVVQVRGKNNCEPTKEVAEFVEAFKKTKLTKKKNKLKIPA